jgi:hypothetical protein
MTTTPHGRLSLEMHRTPAKVPSAWRLRALLCEAAIVAEQGTRKLRDGECARHQAGAFRRQETQPEGVA